MTTHLTPDADLIPYFTFPRASPRSKVGMQDPSSGTPREGAAPIAAKFCRRVWRPPRGGDHSAVANQIFGPYRVICLQEGASLCQPRDSPSQVPRGHRTSLLSKDTSERKVTTKPIMVLAKILPNGLLKAWSWKAHSGALLTVADITFRF